MKQANLKNYWPILATTMFASFMNPFMLSGVTISLPDIQQHFNCSTKMLSWVMNVFLLSNAIVLLPISKISDNLGREKMFKIGLYFFTLASLLSALSPFSWFLLVSRSLQGIGAAMMQVTGLAIVSATFPAEKRGIALGLNIGAVYTGLSLGPFLGGYLTYWGGWQWVFLAAVPFGITSIILAHANLRNSERTIVSKNDFDLKGTIIYGLAIFFFVLGGSNIKEITGLIFFTSGILLFILFIYTEKKQLSPILNIKLFVTNRLFSFSNFAALIHYTATSGIGFLLSLYLQLTKGLSPRDAGLIMVAQPLVMAISAPIAGRFSDKTNPGFLSSIGMVLTFAGLTILCFISETTSTTTIVSVLVLLGLGFGFFSSPNTNAIMGSVDKHHYSIASGTTATMRVVGQTLSMVIATMLIAIMLDKMQISSETTHLYIKAMNYSFMVFAFLCIPGIWFSLQRNKKMSR